MKDFGPVWGKTDLFLSGDWVLKKAFQIKINFLRMNIFKEYHVHSLFNNLKHTELCSD
jgi:hypothetical protein